MYKFFTAIIIYLVILSTLISFVVFESIQEEQKYISLDGGITSDKVEFTQIDEYVDTRLLSKGDWNVHNNTLVYSGAFISKWNDMLLKGIVPDNAGYYTVKYEFDNPEDSRIRFILQKAGIADSESYYATYTGTEINVYEASIKLPIQIAFPAKILSAPISLSGNGQTITTRFNPTTEHIELYHNDNFIGECYGNTGGKTTASHYGGMGVFDKHLVITGITANIHITEEPSFVDLFLLIGSVLVYTIDEKYFPLIFNLLLIKLPIAVLIIGLAFWIRGVS